MRQQTTVVVTDNILLFTRSGCINILHLDEVRMRNRGRILLEGSNVFVFVRDGR